ncbi:MAG: methionyl-tRNA formyltransferase [Propionibacteriaceae bacterium]|jgi:methionyl-tRNA formyltransferase|nr:methionyl-tRNA formyltransferase [Propionibacteriaceae bacterium]
MRLVFAGTPAAALPSLERLAAAHEVAAVLTRPPAARGRSARLRPSPVAAWAAERGIEVLDPPSARDLDLAGRLAELAPDCCPVVAYGGLIPAPLLALPTHGWMNLHFSLLPAYRGAAPVQRAVLAGDRQTGLTVFRLVEALDAGPFWLRQPCPLAPRATAGDVLAELADLGAGLLEQALAAAAAGETPRPQPAQGISLAPKITVEELRLDWQGPAEAADRLIRAAAGPTGDASQSPLPAPGAWTVIDGKRLKVMAADPVAETLPAGRLASRKHELLIGTGTTALRLLWVIPEGRRPMRGADWARGLRADLAADPSPRP